MGGDLSGMKNRGQGESSATTICLDENRCAYRPQGIKCFNRANGLPVGSLEKTFDSHGRATLQFENCNDNGFVEVFLNDQPITHTIRIWNDTDYELEKDNDYIYREEKDMAKSSGKSTMESEFVVKPGDVLKLKEEGGATIKVVSLTIGRGKSFLHIIT